LKKNIYKKIFCYYFERIAELSLNICDDPEREKQKDLSFFINSPNKNF